MKGRMQIMEWLKKLLEGMNLTEEQIKTVTEGVASNYEGFIPKHRFDEVNEAKKQLEADITERDKQLADLKAAATGNEELRKKIEALEQANKAADEEYQAKLKEMAVTAAIKIAVATDVHDPDLIVSLIDKAKIEIDEDGKVTTGLDDQLKALRESKAFLFVEKSGAQFKGVAPKEGSGDSRNNKKKNPWSKEHFNLTEQGRILRDDPELAKKLQSQI